MSFFAESQIGDFTLYLTDKENSDRCTDPFNYTIDISFNEPDPDSDEPQEYIKYGRSLCNNIPCQMCQLQPDCKDGKHRHQTLVKHIETEMPELLI
jgi:hypothetical protein